MHDSDEDDVPLAKRKKLVAAATAKKPPKPRAKKVCSVQQISCPQMHSSRQHPQMCTFVGLETNDIKSSFTCTILTAQISPQSDRGGSVSPCWAVLVPR